MFTSPSRFDGSIQCQKVGLVSNVINHRDDLTDLFAAFTQLFNRSSSVCDSLFNGLHFRDGVIDNHATLLSGFCIFFCMIGDINTFASHFHDGRIHFFNGAGNLVYLRGLLRESIGHLVGDRCNFSRSRGHFTRRLCDLCNGVMDFLSEGIKTHSQFAKFVIGLGVDATCQVSFALSDVFHGVRYLTNRADD